MSYNRNNLNPNVWDVQRNNMPTFSQQQAPFLQQDFGIRQNFNNQNNFYPQNMNTPPNRPHPLPSVFENPPFRNYGNNSFKNNNNNRGNRPGPKFTKRPPIWENDMNRSADNYSNNSNEKFQNNNNNFNQNNGFPSRDVDMRPDLSITGLKGTLERIKKKEKSSNGEIDVMCQKSVSKVSSKFISDIKTMNSESVKDLINNPKQAHKKKVLNMQAQQNIREQNRQKLRTLGNEGDNEDPEADEAVDLQDMPESFISELSKTVDMDLRSGENSDENMDVVRTNLGNDFLTGSEMLLATGFSLLGDNEEPQFEIPEIPPLPKDVKIKPPPPDEISSTVKQENEKLPYGCVSFYGGNVRNWDETEIPKNPDPPAVETNKIEVITSVEVCDYGSGRSQRYDEEIKPVPPPDYGINKIISPSPFLSASSPMSSGTPKHSSIAPSPSHSESNKLVSLTTLKISEVENPEKAQSNVEIQATTIPVLISTSTAPIETIETIEQVVEEPPATPQTPQNSQNTQNSIESQEKLNPPEDTGRRANETYGEYRKRIAEQHRKYEEEQAKLNQSVDEVSSSPVLTTPSISTTPRVKGPQCVQNPPRDRNWMKKDRWGFNQNQNQNQRNNNNNNNNRKSRGDMDRGRDSWMSNNRTNNKDKDEIPEALNYRFNSETNPERLTNILNPKPLDTNRSFNKRARDRTPVNTSPERNFDESTYVPPNDHRPNYYTLKKIMEMDAELTKIHDIIHECDKVIQSRQAEKLIQQKLMKKIQMDRKALFDNLMKRAAKDKNSNSSPIRDLSSQSSKAEKDKRLQTIVDQRKRKNDEILDETLKKKPSTEVVESASAYEKAEKLRREKEDEERRQKEKEDKKRRRLLKLEREEAEKRKLEEKIRLEEMAKTKIKQEPKDKSDRSRERERSKAKSRERSQERSKISREKSVETSKITFVHKENLDHLVYDSKDMKPMSIKVPRMKFHQHYVDEYQNTGFSIVNNDEYDKPPQEVHENPPAERPKSVMSNEIISQPPTPDIQILSDRDPLADDTDYSVWNGNFNSHTSQIMQVLVILESFLLTACEDGKVLKYDITNGDLLNQCDQHRDICNSILYDDMNSVFSVSNDGFMNQLDLENFNLISFVDFGEQLQVIAKSKSSLFIGTKAGKIYKVKNDLIDKPEEALCNTGAMIYCIKAMKEGARNILLVSSKSNPVQIRDANDGLLLRELPVENNQGLNVYDMLFDGGTIYYGTNRNDVYAIDFSNGALKKTHHCGNGAICLKMFDNYLIAACYDGNIYIINTKNDQDTTNICGPSTRLLSIDLWDNKIVATTTDKQLKIMNIPVGDSAAIL